ncbi:16S rRNA (guanine(527)-N(7))-methyltransferase RsmG [Propionibacteriaceae bacterium Y1923]
MGAEAAARDIARRVYGDQSETIERYVDILTSRGVEWGLLGPREPERIWSRHILNCAALDGLVPQGSRVIDVGSGAGLPGLVLAILRPDLEVVLVESLLRRATFLELAVDELGLSPRVSVVRGRAEEQKVTADVVTCRAVAPLQKLLKWTTPHFLPHGRLVALKGASAPEEVAAAAQELRRHKLVAEVVSIRADQEAEATQAIVVRRAF